jgi:hypothetical protein
LLTFTVADLASSFVGFPPLTEPAVKLQRRLLHPILLDGAWPAQHDDAIELSLQLFIFPKIDSATN